MKAWEPVAMVIGVAAFVGLYIWSDQTGAARQAQERHERANAEWNGPCADTTTLVATTTGSPNTSTCPNKRHKMRVQVATRSGEEVAAVVLCECQPEAAK